MPLSTWPDTSMGAADPASGLPIDPGAGAEIALTATATITPRSVATQRGESYLVEGAPLAPVACQVAKMDKPEELVRAGGIRAVATYKAYFPLDTPVTEWDKVSIGEADFEVLGTDRNTTGSLLLTVWLSQIGGSL